MARRHLAPKCQVAVFLICLGATGSPWAASIILGTLAMLLVDLAGVMHWWGMQLNAGEEHAGVSLPTRYGAGTPPPPPVLLLDAAAAACQPVCMAACVACLPSQGGRQPACCVHCPWT